MGAPTVALNRCLDLLDRLAMARVGLAEYTAEVRPAIRRAIGFDGWCLGLADPASRLPNAADVEDAPLRGRLPQFWQFEFAHHASASADLVLAAAARRDDLGMRRLRELLRPDGIGDELRVPLLAGDAYWGGLGMFRSHGARAFSAAELDTATALMPALAAGSRRAWAVSAPPSPAARVPGDPGTLLLTHDGSVVSQTPQAGEWLARLGPGFALSTIPAVVAVLRTRATTSLRTRTADGQWLRVSGGRLSPAVGAAALAVTLRPASQGEITPLLLRAYGLTPRQRAVARQVLAGQSSQQIASTLHLSPHTVNDHVKAIEAKVGAHSRGELAAALTGMAR